MRIELDADSKQYPDDETKRSLPHASVFGVGPSLDCLHGIA
jgi:hypothetical protein